jgi:hypothetical protein
VLLRANVDSQLVAYRTARGCVQGRQGIAAALDRRRTAPFSGYLAHFYMPGVLDSAVLRTTLSIAADPGASVGARALSVGLLTTYLNTNALLRYGPLTGTRSGGACFPGRDLHGARNLYSTLPPDTPQQVRAGIAPLEHDTTQPPEARSAANCLMNEGRASKDIPVQALTTNPRTALTIEYMCGTRFRIKSTLPHQVAIQYEVGAASGRKLLYVAGKLAGQQYGETLLDLDTPGELRILFDGEVVLTKANGGTACT